MRCRTLIALLLFTLPACQALDRLRQLRVKDSPVPVASPHVPAVSVGESPPAQPGSSVEVRSVEPVPADAAHGWTLAAVPVDISNLSGGKGSRSGMVLSDPACPGAFAVASLQGSRWGVTFAGRTCGGFDALHARPAHEKYPGVGFAFAPSGRRFGFLAARDGQRFYVVDGVEGPHLGEPAHAFGQLLFSDDGVSYAYTVGNDTLIVDGKVVDDAPSVEREHWSSDAVGGVGFAAGTHDLHYFRQVRVREYRTGAYLIVSGSRRFGFEETRGARQPGFFRNGVPYWYASSTTATPKVATLVVDGTAVGTTTIPGPNAKPAPSSTGIELVTYLSSGDPAQSCTGVYVWANGGGRVHAVPERLHSGYHFDRSPLASADGAHVMYEATTGDSRHLVVDQVVSAAYERIPSRGFTASGRAVALVRQANRVFALLDGVEMPQAYSWPGHLALVFAEAGERVLAQTSTHTWLGEVRDDALVFTPLEPGERETRRDYQFSADGSTLLCSGMTRGASSSPSRQSVLRNGEVLMTTTVKTNAKFVANRAGSVVLWPVRVGEDTHLFVNRAAIGPMYRFDHACFGPGDAYAFLTNRPLPNGNPRTAPELSPLVCVNGRFFEGLSPLGRGYWGDDGFHVLCTRGKGADGEVVMASYRPQ